MGHHYRPLLSPRARKSEEEVSPSAYRGNQGKFKNVPVSVIPTGPSSHPWLSFQNRTWNPPGEFPLLHVSATISLSEQREISLRLPGKTFRDAFPPHAVRTMATNYDFSLGSCSQMRVQQRQIDPWKTITLYLGGAQYRKMERKIKSGHLVFFLMISFPS